jgi:uncharacterized membrane protein
MDNSSLQWERHFDLPEGVHVSPKRPFAWLGKGWDDIGANPWPSLAYGVAFALGGWLMFGLSLNRPYLFTAAASGFFLVAPLLAGGLYELSRRRAAGEPASLLDSFSCWRRNSGGLSMFGVALALVAIGWERLTAIIFALFGGTQLNPGDPATFMVDVLFSGEHLPLIVAWALAGYVIAATVFALSAFAVPMLVDRQVDFATAMMTSLKAVSANLPAMVVWAALIVALTIFGMATYMLGMIVVMPVLGHATWHAYREVVR